MPLRPCHLSQLGRHRTDYPPHRALQRLLCRGTSSPYDPSFAETNCKMAAAQCIMGKKKLFQCHFLFDTHFNDSFKYYLIIISIICSNLVKSSLASRMHHWKNIISMMSFPFDMYMNCSKKNLRNTECNMHHMCVFVCIYICVCDSIYAMTFDLCKRSTFCTISQVHS